MLQFLTISPQPTEALGFNFLQDKSPEGLPNLFFTPYPTRPNYYPIRIFVIGIPDGVNSIVNDLYLCRFAEVREWSRPLPARHPGEIMRVMTRDFLLRT